MSRQVIFIGTTDNDGTGDPLRSAFNKCNGNFLELYTNTNNVLEVAWAGTETANQAYALAQIGTNLAQQAENDAYRALQTAWSGTSGANSALALAVAGTTAAAQAKNSADTALQTAWSGTQGANAAFAIAVSGTNAAAQANVLAGTALQTAWSGTNGANSAFSIAVAGTNSAAQARNVADRALLTAWSDTQGANAALSIAVAGTTAAKGNCGFSFVIDGGGQAITTGFKGYVEVPFGMWITRWAIFADQSGSAVVDVLKSSGYAGFPTVPSIAGSAKPTLSSAQKNENTTLAGWTRQINGGDIVGFTVNSAATAQIVTVAISGTRS